MTNLTFKQPKQRPTATVENIKTLLSAKGVQFYLDRHTLVMLYEGQPYKGERLNYQIREIAILEGFKIVNLTQAIKYAIEDLCNYHYQLREGAKYEG